MGITGLLPLTKSIQSKIHVKEYAGKTVAVDAYVWLHEGALSCARELAQNKPTTNKIIETLKVTHILNCCRYVDYCMDYVRMLKYYNVTPFTVFDGGYLPAKANTEVERESIISFSRLFALLSIPRLGRRRNENKYKGIALLREGKKEQAQKCFQKCVDVTPEMAYQFIKVLRSEGVQYVVAPYEADAELAYLSRTGKVDAVVTVDSDLIVFGCKRILYKMNSYGDCIEFRRDRLEAVTEVNFRGATDKFLREMCILSGCDYLPSIKGMGLKKAYKNLKELRTVEKVILSVRKNCKMPVPPDYLENFRRANFTFLYQRVYDPDAQALTTVNPVPEGLDIDNMDFLGPKLEPEVAWGIATGDLNPITKTPIVDLMANVLSGDLDVAMGDLNSVTKDPITGQIADSSQWEPKVTHGVATGDLNPTTKERIVGQIADASYVLFVLCNDRERIGKISDLDWIITEPIEDLMANELYAILFHYDMERAETRPWEPEVSTEDSNSITKDPITDLIADASMNQNQEDVVLTGANGRRQCRSYKKDHKACREAIKWRYRPPRILYIRTNNEALRRAISHRTLATKQFGPTAVQFRLSTRVHDVFRPYSAVAQRTFTCRAMNKLEKGVTSIVGVPSSTRTGYPLIIRNPIRDNLMYLNKKIISI
ncbi:PIN domain-like protein, partial [Jimgerdemannia flammicorona]